MNIDDAKKLGAMIVEQKKVISAKSDHNGWKITFEDNDTIETKILINAAGPWINDIINNVIQTNTKKSIRLVRGSHIITKKLYEEEVAFTLQNSDNRIVL